MKLHKIASLLIGAVVALGAWSCTDEVKPEPNPGFAGDGVYFSTSESTEFDIQPETTELTYVIYRDKDGDDLTVELNPVVLDEEGADASAVISVPATVSFVKGEKTAALKMAVDYSKVVAEMVYTINLSLPEEIQNPYGDKEVILEASYAPWTDFEVLPNQCVVTLTGILSSVLDEYDQVVGVRHSMVNENIVQYYIPSPFSDVDISFLIRMDLTDKFVNQNGDEVLHCTMATIETPLQTGSGPLAMSDLDDFISKVVPNASPEDHIALVEKNGGFSYFDPVKGLFALDIADHVVGDYSGSWFGCQYNYIQLGGYKDYSIEFNKLYNIVDDNKNEQVVIQAYRSSDVASFSCDVLPGALDKEQVDAAAEAIKADPDAEVYSDQTVYLTYSLEEEGTYTLVAVGYDGEHNEIMRTSYQFDYATVQAANPWKKVGEAGLTDAIVCSYYNVEVLTWDVQVEESTETPGVYRVVNPYLNWEYNIANKGELVEAGDHYMIIDASDPDYVHLEYSNLGVVMNSRYGAMAAWNLADYLIEQGQATEEAAKRAGMYGVMSEGVITFPTGTLLGIFTKSGNMFNANCDPNNPAFSDESIEFDPTWGEGTFKLEFYDLAGAPARKAAHAPAALTGNMQPRTAANVLEGTFKARGVKAYTPAQMAEIRKANPSQIIR